MRTKANKLLSHYYKDSVNHKPAEEEARRHTLGLMHLLKDMLLMSLGVIAAAFGLRGFLLPNEFIDGGVMGISLLVSHIAGLSLPFLILVFNVPFIIMGYRQISQVFALKSIMAIAALALCVAVIPFPVITDDKLLVSVFGGFFLGTGIGLGIRGGAVIDGTEVFAIHMSKKLNMSVGDIIWIINIVIFSFAAYLLSVETALYSILTYFAASRTVDFLIEGIEEYMGVTIVSEKTEHIRLMILNEMGRGVTLFDGRRGYAPEGEPLQSTQIIYTVVTRLEMSRLKRKLEEIDPDAFIVMHSIKDAKGGVIKKRTIKDKH